MSQFDQTSWADAAYAREFLDHADHYIPERHQLFAAMRSFYRHFILSRGQGKVCDLGCGDGVLTAELLKENPALDAVLVDGSADMLGAARKRFSAQPQLQYVQKSFQAMPQEAGDLPQFQFIVSSFAIHHLEPGERKALFAALLHNLERGGWFMNIETALPRHALFTEWYYALWQEWIIAHSRRFGLKEDFQDVPRKARENPDNKYTPLADQLRDLEAAGFKAVECHYKNGIFAIYTGQKGA
jgi:tRNA (cmo5U34)-methyltransferase